MCVLASRAKKKLAAWCTEKDDEIKKWFDEITEYEDVVVDEEKLSNLLKRTKVYMYRGSSIMRTPDSKNLDISN